MIDQYINTSIVCSKNKNIFFYKEDFTFTSLITNEFDSDSAINNFYIKTFVPTDLQTEGRN